MYNVYMKVQSQYVTNDVLLGNFPNYHDAKIFIKADMERLLAYAPDDQSLTPQVKDNHWTIHGIVNQKLLHREWYIQEV